MGDLRPFNSQIGLDRFAPLAVAAGKDAPASPQRIAYAPTSLKIVHVLRAPLGGLFRHVVDVARGQVERGHRVGLVVDSTTGGTNADAVLAELAPRLALGILRLPITRELSPRDFGALWIISKRIRALSPDVLHGHGAKGAALARLTPSVPDAIRAYTPHGGSLVYSPGTIEGGFYRTLERILNARTDLFLFESTYIADLFRTVISAPQGTGARGAKRHRRSRIRDDHAAPRRYRYRLRRRIAAGQGDGRADRGDRDHGAVRTQGHGDDRGRRPGLADASRSGQSARGRRAQIRFIGHCPARKAFAMGRMLVMPSRAESLPYVALEAAAAGVPIIATDVGGVHEIFGPHSAHLIPPDDLGALIGAITAAITEPEDIHRLAENLRIRVRSEFSLSTMVECNLAAYREAIAARNAAQLA